MKLSKGMKAAINQYFAFKGKGMFPDSATKERCIDALVSEARKSKAGIDIVPGVIFITRGKQSARINGPVWM